METGTKPVVNRLQEIIKFQISNCEHAINIVKDEITTNEYEIDDANSNIADYEEQLSCLDEEEDEYAISDLNYQIEVEDSIVSSRAEYNYYAERYLKQLNKDIEMLKSISDYITKCMDATNEDNTL